MPCSSFFRSASAFAFLSCALFAQPIFVPSTVVFAMESTHMASNGVGGTTTSPGNQAAVFGDDSIIMVVPDSSIPYTAYECSDFALWAAYFGDVDNDGLYGESIVGEVDAIHVPMTAPNPLNIFDVFLSFQVDIPGGGTLNGTPIDDADVVRLLPRGGFVPFIVRSQIAAAQNLTTTSSISALDVDAFAVDEATGDIYWSLTATSTVNGGTVEDGGVIRLRATNYVANPNGTVASVTTGGAEVVLREADVDLVFVTAGLAPVVEVTGLEIDPLGGTFTSVTTGLTMPNLLITSENAINGPAIVTSRLGGQILDLLGVTMNSGPALGLAPTNFAGNPVGTLTALALRSIPLQDTPRMLDIFPTAYTTPNTINFDVGGATPNDFVVLAGVIGEGSTPGSETPRYNIFEPTNPLHLLFTGDGRFYEYYILNPFDGLFQLTVADGPLAVDSAGYARRSYPVPALPPGIAFAFQYADLFTLALSTPVVAVTN